MDLNDAKKKEFILNVKLEATNHSSKVDALDWKTRMADKMERIGFLIELFQTGVYAGRQRGRVYIASDPNRKRGFRV
ncbi:unnamed protein product [Heligmosomoides polygyrus]|uniref:ATP-binding protein n=1 Tax=Heligmosomoides polygyrus TaxID=6339 RepID=A0A183F9J1_HELPZ|nr:unnamed protein product [Heligmosomoides polygyrus]